MKNKIAAMQRCQRELDKLGQVEGCGGGRLRGNLMRIKVALTAVLTLVLISHAVARHHHHTTEAVYRPLPAGARDKFARELKKPEIKERLFRLTKVEVYHQGPKATQAFMESVLNRADARGQTLAEAINDRHYYPAVSLRGWDPGDDRPMFRAVLDKVLAGSNVAGFATGNASRHVGFNGGRQTYVPGTGERFGIEGTDFAWVFSMEKRIKVAESMEQRRLAKLEEQRREQEHAKPVVLASVTFEDRWGEKPRVMASNFDDRWAGINGQ